MCTAIVTLDRLKLHATPAMGEGPCITELPLDTQVEVVKAEFEFGREDAVAFEVTTPTGERGYVSAAHIRFV